MEKVIIIGVDLAKRVFQAHGAAADGSVVFRKKLSRAQLLPFLAQQSACTVAMEACATSHYWGREIEKLGHAVKAVPPIYVKPFVKRQKNDAADAEAIAEAASRPTMRFVALKTEEQQARAMIFRARDLLVRQRTQLINALRGHLAEYGVVAAQGIVHVPRLQEVIEDPQAELPSIVRDIGRTYLDQIVACSEKIAALEKALRTQAAKGETTARLQTMPGIGPIGAMAIEAFAPPMQNFRRGRDFAAWLGLVPRQKSTGGKQILGKTSKMGQRDIRRLLIIGAMAVVRWAVRNGAPEGSWLARMLARKPRMLVATALANKMARAVWAMLVKQEDYQDPMAATA
jgi:transposase